MIRKLSFSKGAALLGGGGGNFLGGFHSAYYNTGRGNQVMGGVHSDGVGSILSYKGGRALRGAAQPITWVENQKNWATQRGHSPMHPLLWETLTIMKK